LGKYRVGNYQYAILYKKNEKSHTGYRQAIFDFGGTVKRLIFDRCKLKNNNVSQTILPTCFCQCGIASLFRGSFKKKFGNHVECAEVQYLKFPNWPSNFRTAIGWMRIAMKLIIKN